MRAFAEHEGISLLTTFLSSLKYSLTRVISHFSVVCVEKCLFSSHSSVRPWDPMTDLLEYENHGIIKTQYRLKAPMIRTTSILSVNMPGKKQSKRKRPSSGRSRLGVAKGSRRSSGGSTPDLDGNTSSIEDEYDDVSVKEAVDLATLEKAIQPLRDLQKESVQQMRAIRMDLRKHYSSHQDEIASLQFKDWIVIFLLVVFQGIYQWYMR